MKILRKFKNRSLSDILERAAVRVYRLNVVRKMVILFVKVPQNRAWVFIVGCYNSGTTLLDKSLGIHPEISNLPDEGVWLTDRLSKPEDFGWTRMWCMCREKVYMDERNHDVDVDLLKKEWGFWYNSQKNIFLEKSIANSARMRWLQANFEPSYFIWIIRNGYAVSEGIRRRARVSYYQPDRFPNGYPIDLCAKQWVENNHTIENDSKYVRNILKIYYEELTEKPEETISKILSYLPINNKSIPVVGKKWKIHRNISHITNMNYESISALSKDDIAEINEVAGSSLEKHGYELIKCSPTRDRKASC